MSRQFSGSNSTVCGGISSATNVSLHGERPLRTLIGVVRSIEHRLLFGVAVLTLCAATPAAAIAKGGPPSEVRVAGVCTSGSAATLRLRLHEGGIELRFEVDHVRAGSTWRVAIVHERRVAWKGAVRTTRPGSFEVRRTLQDLPGTNTLAVQAWGPRGLVCRAVATVPDSEGPG